MLHIKKIFFDVLYQRQAGAAQEKRSFALEAKASVFGLKGLVSVTF
jgi:hypothetical protein